ncbi:hypothetical protein N0V88_004900 [Collariella sp. IMI 366227]|nr:hypothetical protein N0V88_004900 [Collariella sp. IMI 366227]
MNAKKVIVFGPTGKVGSATALAAQQHGAKADLTKPETIRAAVTKTGAKHAFIYMSFGPPEETRSAVETLKAAGVEFVVYLSSLSVQGDTTSIPPSEIIPWLHAQGEIALANLFGADGYAAVRPGVFVSNLLQYKDAIAAGVVKVPSPGANCDYISPEDIGSVCGAVLAKGSLALDRQKTDKNAIYLCGPRRISQRDAIQLIGKAVDKDVTVEDFADEEEAVENITKGLGLPEVGARYLWKGMKDLEETDSMYKNIDYEEAVANVQKYGGKVATDIQDWVETNKAKFI